MTNTNSEREAPRAGPARLAGPDRTGGPVAGRRGPACHPEAVFAAITAAVEWRLMIEANTCRTHWQNGEIRQKIRFKLDRNQRN